MQCSNCGDNAIYTRRYSGESLCASCFKNSIREKVRRTISKYKMFNFGDRVGVAVSGGKDSLSLLNVLHDLNEDGKVELVALTVDEGIEGYRDEAIRNAREIVKKLGIEHIVVSYKELFGFTLDRALSWEDRDISSCSFCGVFRRRAIDEAAIKANVKVVATAHNLDDFVQTFLMNLLHGDVERIGWLSPFYVDENFPLKRVKPFMEIYEEEIALYAYLSKIPFQSVSCPYMHEGLRSEVRDFLNKMESSHPGMKYVLLNSSLQVISKFSNNTSTKSIPCKECGKPSSSGMCGVCRMKSILRSKISI